MNLRVRGPASQATLSGVEPGLSIADFQALLAERTGVAAGQQEVLTGFPPAPLRLEGLGDGATVAALPLRNGESLTVRVQTDGGGGGAGALPTASQPAPGTSSAAGAAAASSAPPAPAAPASGGASAGGPAPATALGNFSSGGGSAARQSGGASVPASPPPVLPQHSAPQPSGGATDAGSRGEPAVSSGGAAPDWAAQQMDEDEALARAIAASLEDAPPGSAGGGSGSGGPSSAPPLPAGGFDADSRQRADGSLIVRRVIDADNSCLFNAVGYVMENGNRGCADRLRALIARTVADDPEKFTEAFLERPNAEYCAWILDEAKWGGAIELSILSKYYGPEIAAYDIQTQRCDVYGSEEGYEQRVMVLYDGLHYDALALAAWPDAAERLDVTVFPSEGPVCQEAARGASELVALAHAAHAFTNTADFTLRCGVCQQGIKGEDEAREHARLTGHQNFQEYR